MSVSKDLIDFDIIEIHKENIQPLASGRSVKALASTFAPLSLSSASTPGDTRNLNDAIREEYEIELKSISDLDDPLDIYDRYIKWTLGAYPSAQATPESQLRPLLEKATKAFQAVSHYKNDPRYLKLWLHYIRFFSDAPRETFAYLARHNIGEGLALFYEEFATWLEAVGRWNQADEVFMLGIEREARPVERLIRKFGEFKHRFESRVANGDDPSSPALPTIRTALAVKVDPFSVSTPLSANAQAPRPSSIGGMSTSRNGNQKLTVFSDAEAPAPSIRSHVGSEAKGWESIGTIAERKKENAQEARPWTGETLKTGKRPSSAPKMVVFKDESKPHMSSTREMNTPTYLDQHQITNLRTGKVERIYVNLEAVYPNDSDLQDEFSFEELRVKARGWLSRDWAAENQQKPSYSGQQSTEVQQNSEELVRSEAIPQDTTPNSGQHEARNRPISQLETTIAIDISKEGKVGRTKKLKIKEIKGVTQTIKTNLESPTGPKLRRKNSAEPTMTLHTKAATNDIIDIFNQPLRNVDPMAGPIESDVETDIDEDDYTSAGESTGTGRISTSSEFEDTEPDIKTVVTSAESVSPWSDFTASKHISDLDGKAVDREDIFNVSNEQIFAVQKEHERAIRGESDSIDVTTPVSSALQEGMAHIRYVPIPPEDYEPPSQHPKDSAIMAQNRLPFMTPIIEKTETSLSAFSIHAEKEDYLNSRTPSRFNMVNHEILTVDTEPLSSPFQEIINEQEPPQVPKLNIITSKKPSASPRNDRSPLIKDVQCNPIDYSIRKSILDSVPASLSSRTDFHDHRPANFKKSGEIRKFIKCLSKNKTSEKTTTSLSLPPSIRFDPSSTIRYTIRRELGKGAFAPVYLAEEGCIEDEDNPNDLIAIKSEYPPTPWEFFIMTLLQTRLTLSHRASDSLLRAHSFHLFGDEGYLLEQYLDQGTLLDLVNLAKSDPTSGQTTLDESVAMFFTIELIRTVEAMHSVGIMHGDLKADNCLVRLPPLGSSDEWDAQYQPDGGLGWWSKGLALIDFGRSIDLTQFRSDVQFIADWKTDKQDCIEMRELRPWTYQVDYYGMAGIVHSLLFGKYIEDCAVETKEDEVQEGTLGRKKGYKIREGLKRYWQTELWKTLFDLLLNPLSHIDGEEDGKMPCKRGLKNIRERMERWLVGEGGRRNGGLRGNLIRLEVRIREKRGR